MLESNGTDVRSGRQEVRIGSAGCWLYRYVRYRLPENIALFDAQDNWRARLVLLKANRLHGLMQCPAGTALSAGEASRAQTPQVERHRRNTVPRYRAEPNTP